MTRPLLYKKGRDMKTLEKDIILICKGWYNQTKYYSVLEAFQAYYQKEYRNEQIQITTRLAIELFLKPAYLLYGNPNSIFEPTFLEFETD